MKNFLNDIYESDLRLRIDSFIEKNFINIIMTAKNGGTYYIIEVDKNLLPFIERIKLEFKSIFDDCNVYIYMENNIMIEWK